jgi:hypothetical protein
MASSRRDHAILHDVVGRDAADGGEGGFTPLPDEVAFGGGGGEADLPGAVSIAEGGGFDHLGGDFGSGAVEFDKQEGFADGIVGMDGLLSGVDREMVHDFECGGEHAGGDDVGDGLAGGGDGVECG